MEQEHRVVAEAGAASMPWSYCVFVWRFVNKVIFENSKAHLPTDPALPNHHHHSYSLTQDWASCGERSCRSIARLNSVNAWFTVYTWHSTQTATESDITGRWLRTAEGCLQNISGAFPGLSMTFSGVFTRTFHDLLWCVFQDFPRPCMACKSTSFLKWSMLPSWHIGTEHCTNYYLIFHLTDQL